MKRTLKTNAIGLASFAVATFLLERNLARADGFGMFDEEFGFGHMFFGGAMMIAFWGAVIVLVVLAVRWLSDSRSSGTDGGAPDAPLRILEQRYARGEIDHDEFERRSRALRGGGSA